MLVTNDVSYFIDVEVVLKWHWCPQTSDTFLHLKFCCPAHANTNIYSSYDTSRILFIYVFILIYNSQVKIMLYRCVVMLRAWFGVWFYIAYIKAIYKVPCVIIIYHSYLCIRFDHT